MILSNLNKRIKPVVLPIGDSAPLYAIKVKLNPFHLKLMTSLFIMTIILVTSHYVKAEGMTNNVHKLSLSEKTSKVKYLSRSITSIKAHKRRSNRNRVLNYRSKKLSYKQQKYKIRSVVVSKTRLIRTPLLSLAAMADWSERHNHSSWAITLLNELKNRNSNLFKSDEMSLRIGRIYYQMHLWKKSLLAYKKVPTSSDLWITSVEERTWAKLRAGLYNQALADVVTLQSPIFSRVVSPEAYFVSAYAKHAVCDYKSVFKVSERFKKNSRHRIEHLELLSSGGKSKYVDQLLKSIMHLSLEDTLDEDLLYYLPQFFYKDIKIKKLLAQNIKRTQSKVSSSNKSIALVYLSTNDRKKLNILFAKLAQRDLNQYSDVIQNLHLIEADAIQRLFMDKNLQKQPQWITKKEISDDLLVFAVDPEDVWLDEIDKYDVKSKSCPTTFKAVSL